LRDRERLGRRHPRPPPLRRPDERDGRLQERDDKRKDQGEVAEFYDHARFIGRAGRRRKGLRRWVARA
jgi:hypothetical protein